MSPGAPSAPVAAVIARMQATLSPLPQGDGVACFTRLYLAVTEGVQERLAGAAFADPAFLALLDQRFADLFFDALASPPPAWRPLVEARARTGIAPIQFALAGMNAHINRDLPVALVAACREAKLDLREGSPQRADYLRVNDVLAAVEKEVKRPLLGRRLRLLSRLLHTDRLADVVAMWDVRQAREAAWANGEALWALRDEPALGTRFLAALDRSVGLAGRGLLVPADSLAGRLARRFGL